MKKQKRINIGKWLLIGVSDSDRRRIYANARQKAKNILKNRYKEEYFKLINSIILEEFNKLKELIK